MTIYEETSASIYYQPDNGLAAYNAAMLVQAIAMDRPKPHVLRNGYYTPQKNSGLPVSSNRHGHGYRRAVSLDTGMSVSDLDYYPNEETEYVTLDQNYTLYPCVDLSQPRGIQERLFQNDRLTSPLKRYWASNNTLQRVTENSDLYINGSTPISPRSRSDSRSSKGSHSDSRSRSENDLTCVPLRSISSDTSDDDGDDYGFLSSSLNFSSSAMHKSKSPITTRKILPKRWRSKSKTIPAVSTTCQWSPEGSCTWCSMSGRKVALTDTNLLKLSTPETTALRKISLAKLQSMDLGCPVAIPKDGGDIKRPRRAILSLRKKSHSANITGLLDNIAERSKNTDSKDCQPVGLVFGISLSKCIANDIELRKRRSSKKENLERGHTPRKSSSSSQGSTENYPQNGGNVIHVQGINEYKRSGSNDSLSESESSRNTNTSLIDALSLSTPGQDGGSPSGTPIVASDTPQVPRVVKICLQHIETYGLRVLGIFRIGSSKKRSKQLRDEFDSGKDVHMDDMNSPHDVGALLKEYFRDLPEPLFTRQLYSPFVATRRITDKRKQALAVKLLISLLPVPNRDTLWTILRFLAKVARHCSDEVGPSGEQLPGNKMDSHNLATLFGPNILHKAKAVGDKGYPVESAERAEERKEVIEVVQDLIDNHDETFEVTSDLRDDVIRLLMETEPDTADQLLKRMSNTMGIDTDLDTCSSVFEESDISSMHHSPSYEADIIGRSVSLIEPRAQYRSPHHFHQPVRLVKSDDTGLVQKDTLQVPERSRMPRAAEFDRLGVPRTTSVSKSPRTPRVKISRDSSSPDIIRRVKAGQMERPKSEIGPRPQALTIPKPVYMRQNSCSSTGSYPNTSSNTSPVGSESSGPWLLPTPPPSGSNSPKSPWRTSNKYTSSQQRPLGVLNETCDRSRAASFGAADLNREKWQHWENLASNKPDDNYEQETLV